jgi:hypothetical protein
MLWMAMLLSSWSCVVMRAGSSGSATKSTTASSKVSSTPWSTRRWLCRLSSGGRNSGARLLFDQHHPQPPRCGCGGTGSAGQGVRSQVCVSAIPLLPDTSACACHSRPPATMTGTMTRVSTRPSPLTTSGVTRGIRSRGSSSACRKSLDTPRFTAGRRTKRAKPPDPRDRTFRPTYAAAGFTME